MAKQRLLFIFSLILSAYCFAQMEEADSVVYRRTLTPSIYLDYGKLFTIPTNFETKYEGGLELLFMEKFPLIVEVGQATLTPEGAYSNGTYESEGFYYRIGAGYVGDYDSKHHIGLHLMYGQSSFNENGRIQIESPSGSQGTFIDGINRENLKASWYEVVVYSDMQLLKESEMFHLGIKLRLRVLDSYDTQDPIDVYAIPGYGRSFDKTIPAANLFLKVSF